MSSSLGDNVELMKYDSSPAALVQSFVDRFPAAKVDQTIETLWQREKPHFTD